MKETRVKRIKNNIKEFYAYKRCSKKAASLNKRLIKQIMCNAPFIKVFSREKKFIIRENVKSHAT